jgi:hypothetical protein
MGNVSTRRATVNFSRNTLYHVITFKLCGCIQTFEPFATLRNFAFKLTFQEDKIIEQLGNWILIHPVGIAQKLSLEYGKRSGSILIQATVTSIHILFSSLFTNHVFTFCFIQSRSRVNELKKMWEDSVVANSEALSRHLYGGTEENQYKPRSGQSTSRYSNQAPPKYKRNLLG